MSDQINVVAIYVTNIMDKWLDKSRKFHNLDHTKTIVQNVQISETLYDFSYESGYERERALYWMDLGNSRDTGQVVLSTIVNIKKPESDKYIP